MMWMKCLLHTLVVLCIFTMCKSECAPGTYLIGYTATTCAVDLSNTAVNSYGNTCTKYSEVYGAQNANCVSHGMCTTCRCVCANKCGNCANCAAGKYKDRLGPTQDVSNPAYPACYDCFSGSYSSAGATACTYCAGNNLPPNYESPASTATGASSASACVCSKGYSGPASSYTPIFSPCSLDISPYRMLISYTLLLLPLLYTNIIILRPRSRSVPEGTYPQ